MTEAEYIRSLDDEGLARYFLRMCIVFTAGSLEAAGVEIDPDMDLPEHMVNGLLQALQQPHREGRV
jgi:hypothetical protein